MITTRLFHEDSYLAEFSAHMVERAGVGCRVYLDRTAFYPTSGGQPHDIGEIAGIPVVDVIDEEKRIAHITAAPVEGVEVACSVDWTRRFDHMQQHSGQHLLSAVLIERCGAETVGFHMGEDASTIDLAAASLAADELVRVELRVNELVAGNLPVTVTYEEASEAKGLRRPPERQGMLRIVSVEGVDRSPCGGTHVRATGEIGAVLVRGMERVRGNVRLEFLCGLRAVRRARGDFEALSRVARVFSSSLDDAPSLAEAQREALEAADKARRRAAGELARFQGREAYEAAVPGPDGIRREVRRKASGSIDEELRAQAQGFVSRGSATFVAAFEEPPSVLLAVSADSGLDAGNVLKALLARHGGRGGGNPRIAQGSLPSREKLDAVIAEL